MDRDKKGRFAKGNPGNPNAKGRPKRNTEDKYLQALRDTVKLKDWEEITEKAIQQARKGDRSARQWLSDYLLGKPIQNVNIEAQTDLTVMLAWDDAELETDTSEAA